MLTRPRPSATMSLNCPTKILTESEPINPAPTRAAVDASNRTALHTVNEVAALLRVSTKIVRPRIEDRTPRPSQIGGRLVRSLSLALAHKQFPLLERDAAAETLLSEATTYQFTQDGKPGTTGGVGA